jgi:hypothetical protein
MAIRKDLDDMLNNLKDGKPLEQPSDINVLGNEPVPQDEFKNVSVDDLLTSLLGAPNSETAAEPIVKPKKKKIVVNPDFPKYRREVIDWVDPIGPYYSLGLHDEDDHYPWVTFENSPVEVKLSPIR